MKKTISINIGGVIFHIEEDGYEKLKGYLSSIQKYFSSFEDSTEILADIEGRVAERFLNKQKAESKQVISLTDVEELIAAMGTVADFEAIEQSEDLISEPLTSAAPKSVDEKQFDAAYATSAPQSSGSTSGPRKLYRDLRRKLFGGVAAGLAHYFTIDPLWVRLLFLMMVMGFLPLQGAMGLDMEGFFGPLAGLSILVYIAMWVAFPGSVTLEEDTKIKKFYRNPDRKVVGGVAAGVASYFGVDIGVVRFVWVISIFLFGTGVLAYIILWVIAPVANTLTEKMEMQGEPITLSNIESNIKQSLNLDEKNGEENGITRLLLLPFRAIALVIGALGKILKGIGPVLRILIGVFLVGMAAISLLGIVIGGAVVMGLASVDAFDGMPAPFLMFREFPTSLLLSGLLATAVPMITILLLGLTLLSNRKIVGGSVWLTLLGLWVVGIVISTVQGIAFQRNYAKRGEHTQISYHSLPAGLLTLDQDDTDPDENIDLDINLAGMAASDSLKIETKISARGRNREDAENNAAKISYDVEVKNDSVFYFHEGPATGKSGPFRDQRINVTMYVPYDKPFAITRNFWHAVSHYNGNFNHLDSYELHDDNVKWNSLRWVVKRDSGLVCINLPEQYIRKNSSGEEDGQDYSSFGSEDSDVDLGERGEFVKQFSVPDFQKIDMGGAYAISIRRGDEFKVSADGEESDVEDLTVKVENGTLIVKRKSGFNLFENRKWNRIGVVITMPTVEELSLSGANKARISGFDNLNKLNISISGASKTDIDVTVKELTMDLTGASKATLRGRAESANLDLTGACKLDATGMQITKADVDASGASKAQLGTIRDIRKSTSGASKISVQE
ncbi:MAG TPA: PspC domain-containing protein [Dyadobacter sp.]|jgi:phage shock protein PspC (stress-responsive transcriptional regulator)|nr:PspC domain-containing protein [Dyadobacter sp.]